MRWVRQDVQFYESDWVDSLSGLAQLAWSKLWLEVKKSGRRGQIPEPALTTTARLWKVNKSDIEEMVFRAKEAGELVVDNGTWILTKWDDTQDVDTTNAERQRQYKARQKATKEGNGVTSGNALPNENNALPCPRDIDMDIDRITTNVVIPRDDVFRSSYRILCGIPCVAAASGGPLEDRVDSLTRTAHRLGIPSNELEYWSEFVVNLATSKPYFNSETTSIGAAAILEKFASDIRREMDKRAPKVHEAEKQYENVTAAAVAVAIDEFRKLGGGVKRDTDVEAYASVLEREGITADTVRKHSGAALRNVPWFPPAFGFADLLRPFVTESKSRIKLLESDDDYNSERSKFNAEAYGSDAPRTRTIRETWERNRDEVPA